jgi:DNA-binding protein H-NS
MSTTQTPRNIETMTYAELEREERLIQAQKTKLYQQAANQSNKTAKAQQMLAAMAKELGVPAAATQPTTNGGVKPQKLVIASKPKIPAKAKAKRSRVRYRDPSNPKNTWSGRGPAPGWVVTLEKTGKNRSEFAVA